MRARQSLPRVWLVADARLGPDLPAVVRKLPRGSGVLVLFHQLPNKQRSRLLRRLRHRAISKSLAILDEAKAGAARVHDLRELRRALLAGTPVILLSPIHSSRSHPDWQTLPLMRAAAFARLGGRELFALGGMDERRFRRIERLGFIGWAGIDAFKT